MACTILDEYGDIVRELVDHQSMTYSEVSNYLSTTYGSQRGFSERSVRTFCQENQIMKSGPRVSEEELTESVNNAIQQVQKQYTSFLCIVPCTLYYFLRFVICLISIYIVM